MRGWTDGSGQASGLVGRARASGLAVVLGLVVGLLSNVVRGAPSSLPDTLDELRARGELRWGADANGGAPYIFPDPMDPTRIMGFEVELAAALARKLGVTSRPVQGQWESLLDLLNRRDFDVALNGIEVAEEKRRVCALSRPYYVAAEKLTVRRGDERLASKEADWRGYTIGTLPGSVAERIVIGRGAMVKTYEGGQNQIYLDLRDGRTDGVLLDEPVTRYYGSIDPALAVTEHSWGAVAYAVAVRSEDVRLRTAIDGALDELAREGELRRIYERWGLWNAETARALGDPDETARASVAAEAFEAWRTAVGEIPPFWERVRSRYPATFPIFFRAALLTLSLSLVAFMVVAVPVGLVVAVSRVYGPAPLRWLAVAYVEVVRGTPLLVQLTILYFGLPELGLKLDPFVAGALALGLNYAAAEAENYRAGLQAVPVGQLEAAWSLGMTTSQALRFVLGPQALRVAIPPMTNDFIALLKDSSLVSLVTLTELTKTYSSLGNSMRDHLGLGVVVALWYLAIGLPFALLARAAERRLGGRHRRPLR